MVAFRLLAPPSLTHGVIVFLASDDSQPVWRRPKAGEVPDYEDEGSGWVQIDRCPPNYSRFSAWCRVEDWPLAQIVWNRIVWSLDMHGDLHTSHSQSEAAPQQPEVQSNRASLEKRRQLREMLSTRFNEGELRTLCFDLGIDYDDLSSGGKTDKARELVAYFERRSDIASLVPVGARLRSDIAWSEVL